MNCKNCNNLINEDTKFCGKCGSNVEVPLGTNNLKQTHTQSEQDKLVKEVKGVGKFFNIFGYIKVVAGIAIALFIVGNSDLGSIISFGYSDAIFTAVIGVLWIILGGRISKNIDSNTRKYLLTIFWLLIIAGIIGFLVNIAQGGHGTGGIVIAIFFAIYANKGLKKLKQIEIKNPSIEYKLQGWKWVWFVLVSILVIIASAFIDAGGMTTDPTELPIDKGTQHSEVSGNMYRNTKYHFRIKFPEGWKIGVGDGIHIVQKASSENGTISIIVQQFDLGGEVGFSSIKDAGTSKEFIDTVLEGATEKFSDVKIINYGETKIDNEPAYWVEYSASSQVLDYKLKMTNLIYYIAKGDTMYSIGAGTATDDYSKIKPIFLQSVSTFVLENY